MQTDTTVTPLSAVHQEEARRIREVWVEPRQPRAGGYWRQVLCTSLPLWCSDVVALVIACFAGYEVATVLNPLELNHFPAFTNAAVGLLTAALSLHGLYPAAGVHPAVELRHLVVIQLQLAGLTVFAILLQHSLDSPYIPLAITAFAVSCVLLPVLRSLVRGRCHQYAWWGYPTLLVGDAKTCDRISHVFNRDGRQGLRPLGRFQTTSEYWRDTEHADLPWLGPLEEVVSYARKNHAYWLIIALPEQIDAETRHWFEYFRHRFPHVVMVDGRQELPCLWNRAIDCGGLAAMKVEERLLLPEQQFSKRVLDLVLVFLVALLVVPLIGLLAIIMLVTHGRPVFYRGRRIGVDGTEFDAWKFRSMIVNADQVLQEYLLRNPQLREEFSKEHKLKDDPRVTRFGRFLRRTSLDELPQLWNVLKGEMSLVGPRPICPTEVHMYGQTMREYARVLPGITGMWQISGRNDTSYEDRKAYVRYYVRNWSPWLDLYILARTIKVVLKCEGAY